MFSFVRLIPKRLQSDPALLLKYQNQFISEQQQNINQLNILNNLNIAAQQQNQTSFQDALNLNQQQQKQQQIELMSFMAQGSLPGTRDVGVIEKIMVRFLMAVSNLQYF
jgi:hypothetical protein